MDMHSGYLQAGDTSVGRNCSPFNPLLVSSNTFENSVEMGPLRSTTFIDQQQLKGGEHLTRHLPPLEDGSLSEDLAQFSTSSSTSGGDLKDLTAPNITHHHQSLEPETFKTSTPTTITNNPQPSQLMPYQGLHEVENYSCTEEIPWLHPQSFEKEYAPQAPFLQPPHHPFLQFPVPGMCDENQSIGWPMQFPHPSQHSPRLPPTQFQQPSMPTMGGGCGYGGWPRNLGLENAGAYIDRSCILDGGASRRKNATRESTSTLKSWLQEHIKNPYPTKGEKIMLAIITKMTLTQVSTWFANARRRLKKENKMTWAPRTGTEEDSETTRGSSDQCEDDFGGNVVKEMHPSIEEDEEEESRSSTSSGTSSAEGEVKRVRHDQDGEEEEEEEPSHSFQPLNLGFDQSETSTWKDGFSHAQILPPADGFATSWSPGFDFHHQKIQTLPQMIVPKSNSQWPNDNYQNTTNINDRFLPIPWHCMNQISRYQQQNNPAGGYSEFNDPNLVTSVHRGFNTSPVFEAFQDFTYRPPQIVPLDYPLVYRRQVDEEKEEEQHECASSKFVPLNHPSLSPIVSSEDHQPSSFLNELTTSHLDKVATG